MQEFWTKKCISDIEKSTALLWSNAVKGADDDIVLK